MRIRLHTGGGAGVSTILYRSAAPDSRRRSAMGEYIAERPLSASQPTPSAFDYYPSTKTVYPSSPSHSIHSRPFPLTKEVSAGPSEYSTRRSSVWKHKTFTITRKGITQPYDIREHAHITCSPGAGQYHRVNGNVGMGTRRSMSARHREGLHVGYPNSLIQPVDTLGFATPGPNLRCKSEIGPERSFGLALKPTVKEEESPGPASYSLQLPTPSSPGVVIGQKLKLDSDPCYPAPNTYTIPGTVGRGLAKSFGTKSDTDTDQQFPSPDKYNVPRPHSTTHCFNYRPFPSPARESPGPAEYTKTHSDLSKSPEYSCREKCRPVFPDILQYPEYTPLETPGAGEYEYDHEFVDNSAPKYSHGLPLPMKPNNNPSPNHYQVQHEPTQTRPPYHSMARRLPDHTSPSPSPGPAEYAPKQRPSSAVSITPRRTRDRVAPGPAANQYHLSGTLTRHGHSPGPMASLKSRRSSVCYSGFPTSHLSRLASLAL